MKSPLRCCAALLLLAGAAQIANAQVITDGTIDRGLRYPSTSLFEGEPWTQRYNYGTGGIFYLNGDSRQLRYLDYLDRADRARKFGYRIPVDPYFDDVPVEEEVVAQPVAPPPQPRIFIGGGLGFLRRR